MLEKSDFVYFVAIWFRQFVIFRTWDKQFLWRHKSPFQKLQAARPHVMDYFRGSNMTASLAGGPSNVKDSACHLVDSNSASRPPCQSDIKGFFWLSGPPANLAVLATNHGCFRLGSMLRPQREAFREAPVEKPRLFKAAIVEWSFGPPMNFPCCHWLKKRRSSSLRLLRLLRRTGQIALGTMQCRSFWQESKPISFFNAILDEYKVTAVFDVTAGSGAFMEASLTRGVVYHGLCLNKEH